MNLSVPPIFSNPSMTTAGRPDAPMARRESGLRWIGPPGVPARLFEAFGHLRGRFRVARTRQAERKALVALLAAEERMLTDIGLGREEVVEMIRELDRRRQSRP